MATFDAAQDEHVGGLLSGIDDLAHSKRFMKPIGTSLSKRSRNNCDVDENGLRRRKERLSHDSLN